MRWLRRKAQPTQSATPAATAERYGWRHRRRWLLIIVALAGITLALFALLRPTDPRFVIVITPFADSDGRTGQQIAGALARQLRSQGGDLVFITVSDTRPMNAAEALALAQTTDADILIWGQAEAGSLLDSPGLRPAIVYMPHHIDVSSAWQSFDIRFAMPQHFTLSSAPINGQTILAPYLLTLVAYHHGEADLAIEQLQRLLDVAPQLTPVLPKLLHGNLLWARGWYSAAAAEYRAALEHVDGDRSLLTNNLGAILLDSGDPAALGAFAETIDLLDGRDLGQLRVNLALWALREQRAHDAVSDLEQARNLLPANPELELLLATAYRESGQLDQALAVLDRVDQAKARLFGRAPQTLHAAIEARLTALAREERALVNFERLLPLAGPLYWSLEAADPLPPADDLRRARDQMRSAAELSALAVSRWRQLAASEAAIYPGAGLVATGQAERAELAVRRQRLSQALLEAALQAAEGRRSPDPLSQILAALFGTAGNNSAIATLTQLRDQQPGDVATLLALGLALRLDQQFDQARQTYQAVIELEPQLPDGYAGVGMAALKQGDREAAQALFRAALDRNNRFFPAHLALARMAEQDGNWTAAIAHWRALVNWQQLPFTQIGLARALRRSGAGGFAEAERILASLATEHVEATIELARLYNDAGLPAVAAEVYRDALRLEPRSSIAAFELGETYIRLNELDAAERSLRDALNFDERNLDARLRLAELYEGPLNQPARAIEQYRIALGQGINDLDRLIRIGRAAIDGNAATAAIQALERATAIDSNSVTARQLLARAYLLGNRLEAATQTAQQTLAATEGRSEPEARIARTESLLTLAEIARRRNEPDAAADFYRQTIALDPQSLRAHVGLGELASEQGNWGVALGFFETAARLPGGDADAKTQFWLGEALLRSNDLFRAMNAYQQALAIQPHYPAALLGLAQTYYAQGRADEALQTVERALQQDSSYAEAHLFRGKLLQEAGRFNEARAAYDAAIRANDRLAESFYRRALLAIRTGDTDQAIRDLNRAIALQRNFAEAHYWLGRAYYAQGRTESAQQAIEQALLFNPDYSEALFYSGLIAEDRGNIAAARSAYQTLVNREPTSEWGRRALAQLERLQ